MKLLLLLCCQDWNYISNVGMESMVANILDPSQFQEEFPWKEKKYGFVSVFIEQRFLLHNLECIQLITPMP